VGATFERAFGEKKEHPRARAIRALRRTAGASLHTLQGRQTISDAELQALYSRAEFAFCPVGDTPESKRVYDALRAGSVPLLSSKFVPPPLGSWRSFSARIEYNRSSGGLLLPRASRLAALQRGVRQMRDAFTCDATRNERFREYLRRSLARVRDAAAGRAARSPAVQRGPAATAARRFDAGVRST